MLLALPLPPTKGAWAVHKQDWILGGAIAIAIASLIIHFRRGRGTLSLIVFGTAVLLSCNVVWNKSFRNYVDHHKHEELREVFRKPMHRTFHWPVYGRYDNALARIDEKSGSYSFATLPFVALASAIAAAWFTWAWRRGIDRPLQSSDLVVLLIFQLALIIAFAACEPWPSRFSLQISGYNEFKKDLPRFTGIADTLRSYVSLMPSLEWYGQHYPPGNLILLQIEKAVGIQGFAKSIVVLLAVLTVIPLHRLARELGLDDSAAALAVLLFAASSSVLIYCTINTTSLVLFPGTVCLWMLVRALRTESPAAAVMLGLSFAFYLLFSFSASIVGVLMALTAILGWFAGVFPLRNIIRAGVISLVVIGAIIALLYLITGFNLVACFIAAVRGHHDQQGNGGFDDATRWLIRSSGNILSYTMSTVPMCILCVSAAASTWKERRTTTAASLNIATVLTIIIAGFSGLFYVETERIWIFLTPAVAIGAGYEIARRRRKQERESRLAAAILALVLVISCTQEFLFLHYR